MVMIALLEPYQAQLSVLDKLTIVLTDDHIEAGLWNPSARTLKTFGPGMDGKTDELFIVRCI